MAAIVRAGGPFFAVDEVATLEFPLASIRCKEISNTRAATRNGFLKHFFGDVKEDVDVGNGEATGDGIGVKAGAEQDLVRINVSDPCDHLLVHE